MRYYIIAGEASGDLHGSNLMRGLYREDPGAVIRFWGGGLMDAVCRESQEEQPGLVRDYNEGAVSDSARSCSMRGNSPAGLRTAVMIYWLGNRMR